MKNWSIIGKNKDGRFIIYYTNQEKMFEEKEDTKQNKKGTVFLKSKLETITEPYVCLIGIALKELIKSKSKDLTNHAKEEAKKLHNKIFYEDYATRMYYESIKNEKN